MASSTGSFPACRRPSFRGGALALGLLVCASIAAGEMPDYARQALTAFHPGVPKGWAYRFATVHNQRQFVERFDPSRPPAEQWTLLQHNRQPPTAKETDQYARSRTGDASAAPRATFQRSDIDPASVVLIREDAERGEFRCAFRAESIAADKMLGHLTLRLTIAKRQPHVERYELALAAPYSPVLGVKMRELLVQMSFSPPSPERPALPVGSSSHFLGRIFLLGVEENISVAYSDFVRVD